MTSDARFVLRVGLVALTGLALARFTPVPATHDSTVGRLSPSPQVAALRDGLALDVNRATAADLDLLPGVGPSLASRIVEARDRSGPFLQAHDMLRVRGVGPKTLARLKPFLRFDERRGEEPAQAR